MAANYPPIAPGTKSNNSALAADLGKEWVIDGCRWRLVKADASLTCAKKYVAYKTDMSTGIVDALAAAEHRGQTAGLCHPNQVAVADGDYFLVQRSGYGTAVADEAVAAHAAIKTLTDGKVDDAAAAFDDTVGYCGNTAAASDGDEITIVVDLP